MESFTKKQLLNFKLEAAARDDEQVSSYLLGLGALSRGLVQVLCERGWNHVDAAQAVSGQLECEIRDVMLSAIDG